MKKSWLAPLAFVLMAGFVFFRPTTTMAASCAGVGDGGKVVSNGTCFPDNQPALDCVVSAQCTGGTPFCCGFASASTGGNCVGTVAGSSKDGNCRTGACQSGEVSGGACPSGGICCVVPLKVGAGGTGSVQCAPGQNCYKFPDQLNANVPQLVNRLVTAVLGLAGAIFFAMFMWGGVRYLTAGGSAEDVKKARQVLVNAVIGMVIIALSYFLVYNVIHILTNAGSANG